MKSKWISRKLLVAIVTTVAIAFGIFKGSPEAEAEVVTKGTELADALMALATAIPGAVYIFAQGKVDAKKPEEH